MSYIITIFAIGILIFVHELGHFIAAKLTNIPISVFSIGFGPRIWHWERNGVEYRISLIPVGGYVKPKVQSEAEFYTIPWNRRIIFAAGGPLGNLVFAGLVILVWNICSLNISFSSLLIDPVVKPLVYMWNLVCFIPELFKQHDQISGVVGIVVQGSRYTGLSITKIIGFSFFLNINLIVFNMLPIPPCDGGSIVVYILDRINPKFRKLHVPLAVTGIILVLGLMVYATILDICKIAS
jgi:regulator of sigma E protease